MAEAGAAGDRALCPLSGPPGGWVSASPYSWLHNRGETYEPEPRREELVNSREIKRAEIRVSLGRLLARAFHLLYIWACIGGEVVLLENSVSGGAGW